MSLSRSSPLFSKSFRFLWQIYSTCLSSSFSFSSLSTSFGSWYFLMNSSSLPHFRSSSSSLTTKYSLSSRTDPPRTLLRTPAILSWGSWMPLFRDIGHQPRQQTQSRPSELLYSTLPVHPAGWLRVSFQEWFDYVSLLILRSRPCPEIYGFLIERTLIPAHEAEVVGWAQEEWVLVCPLEHMEWNYSHSFL